MNLKAANFFIFVSFVIFGLTAKAEEIKFNDDVLPTESVMPKLDSVDAVRNRLLSHKGRFEIGLDYLWAIDELFFNTSLYGFQAYYHLSNDIGLGFKYYQYGSGTNDYGKQFEQATAGNAMKFDRAPAPKSIAALSLLNRIMYGKISVTKETILPFIVNIEYDLGLNKYGDKTMLYSAVGLSHKIYFQKNIGVGLTYHLQVHEVPNPVSVSIKENSPVPAESDFTKKVQISQSIALGLSYLF
ncbi:MAG: outer membrane beta-barrel domain-containing protein [Bdellovibrio sp.]|nr:outer membrane beta-barrel domain-containing protein [Bdellovibrio sp.]